MTGVTGWLINFRGLYNSQLHGHIVDEYVGPALGTSWTHSHRSKRKNTKGRMHGEATRQTSAFNFSAAVTTQGAAASSQGNSITPAWGALTSCRKNYIFGQAEKSALERASQSVVPASVQEGVSEENFLSPVVCPLLSLSSSGGGRGGEGGSLWSKLGSGELARSYVVCPVCWSRYRLRAECSNWVCFRKNSELYSFRWVFLLASQRDYEGLPPDANMCWQHLGCSGRSHDGSG